MTSPSFSHKATGLFHLHSAIHIKRQHKCLGSSEQDRWKEACGSWLPSLEKNGEFGSNGQPDSMSPSLCPELSCWPGRDLDDRVVGTWVLPLPGRCVSTRAPDSFIGPFTKLPFLWQKSHWSSILAV
jgi:hypothetical protein